MLKYSRKKRISRKYTRKKKISKKYSRRKRIKKGGASAGKAKSASKNKELLPSDILLIQTVIDKDSKEKDKQIALKRLDKRGLKDRFLNSKVVKKIIKDIIEDYELVGDEKTTESLELLGLDKEDIIKMLVHKRPKPVNPLVDEKYTSKQRQIIEGLLDEYIEDNETYEGTTEYLELFGIDKEEMKRLMDYVTYEKYA